MGNSLAFSLSSEIISCPKWRESYVEQGNDGGGLMISESRRSTLARHPDSADPLRSRVDLGEAPTPVCVFTVLFTRMSEPRVE